MDEETGQPVIAPNRVGKGGPMEHRGSSSFCPRSSGGPLGGGDPWGQERPIQTLTPLTVQRVNLSGFVAFTVSVRVE